LGEGNGRSDVARGLYRASDDRGRQLDLAAIEGPSRAGETSISASAIRLER
jgi:hypothetical protein